MGSKVFRDGRLIGIIKDVLLLPANDVYVIETGEKPILLPALKKVVKEIDIKAGRMIVELPEGLL